MSNSISFPSNTQRLLSSLEYVKTIILVRCQKFFYMVVLLFLLGISLYLVRFKELLLDPSIMSYLLVITELKH